MTTATPWADAFDDIGWDLPQILEVDHTDRAVTHLKEYFATDPRTGPMYTGALFNRLGGGGDAKPVRNKITRDDLLSLSLLDVPVRGIQVAQLLEPPASAQSIDLDEVVTRDFTAYELPYDLEQLRGILASIPTDVGLGSKKATEHLKAGNLLWTALRRRGFGPARVSKLIARKRPKLFPIIDSVIKRELGTNTVGFYENLRTVLRAEDKALVRHLKSIRAEAAEQSGDHHIADLSTIRVFDIIIWMAGNKRTLLTDPWVMTGREVQVDGRQG